MKTKKFSVDTVLSITTGKLFTEIEEIYSILNFMTGTDLYTHQLPRAFKPCAEKLLSDFPELARFSADRLNASNYKQCISAWVLNGDFYGSYYVKPLPEGSYEAKDPITELMDIYANPRTTS